MKLHKITSGLAFISLASTAAVAQLAQDHSYDGGAQLLTGSAFDGAMTPEQAPAPNGPLQSGVLLSFAGVSQYDVAGVGRNFVPPDTMGAVGTSQYVSVVNGGVGIYSKTDGSRQSFLSDTTFWAAAGQQGTNGDTRILFNAATNRWVAAAFGASLSDLQIAVSDTSNANGSWQSVKFTGYAGAGFGGAVADYPTLAIDANAVYIGTNNFAKSSATGAQQFQGTTLNVIPLASIFGASGPSVAGNVQFQTPFDPVTFAGDYTRGYAIQGVNSNAAGTTGKVLAVSFASNNLTRYDILNAGTAGATRTDSLTTIGATFEDNNAPGRQPSGYNGLPSQVIDTGDPRVGSSVWEVNGRIYSVHTVTEPGSAFTVIRYDVLDSVTGAVLDEGDLGNGGVDFYYGSIAVNAAGQVVIGYDRSNYGLDGNITFAARTFDTSANGKLIFTSGELLLKVSSINDYHTGSLEFQAPAGRQRFGDYSAVSLDPTDGSKFWATNEIALEYNSPAAGHPNGTGGPRWGTWVAEIEVGTVPEPATWAMMIVGFGMVGTVSRRRRHLAAPVV